jgi:uncharacterized protein (DUF488 family)
MATLFTIGHSTRSLRELLEVLEAHSIELLADVRSFPMSRRLPHFNREALERSLPEAGIRYVWMKDLGGRRKKSLADSPNLGLRNQSFRNYADYMLTPEFEHAVAELVEMAEGRHLAAMCAERLYFRCHRLLISDWLLSHGHRVLHIDDRRAPKAHQLTREAKLVDRRLVYPRHGPGCLFEDSGAC